MEYHALEQIPPKELLPGITARLVHTQHLTIAHWRFEPDADLLEHAHPHEQVVNMMRGEFRFTVEGETRLLRPGDVVVIPPHARHSGRSITECYIIDVFYPVREDYQ